MKDKYLRETRMVDFSNPAIQKLIQNMKWKEMGEFERIKAIYNYVRDDVLFGYNIDDGISASKVLADGYGQCNTKGTLFMALLRACNIPCRVHGFTIDKSLQKGAMTGFVYRNAPKSIFHSWISEISLLSLIGTILIFRARESIRILVFMIVQMNC